MNTTEFIEETEDCLLDEVKNNISNLVLEGKLNNSKMQTTLFKDNDSSNDKELEKVEKEELEELEKVEKEELDDVEDDLKKEFYSDDYIPDKEKVENIMKIADLFVGKAILLYFYTIIKDDALKSKLKKEYVLYKDAFHEFEYNADVSVRSFVNCFPNTEEYKFSATKEMYNNILIEFSTIGAYIDTYNKFLLPNSIYYKNLCSALNATKLYFVPVSDKKIQYYKLCIEHGETKKYIEDIYMIHIVSYYDIKNKIFLKCV